MLAFESIKFSEKENGKIERSNSFNACMNVELFKGKKNISHVK
jgi:hypothetical protein